MRVRLYQHESEDSTGLLERRFLKMTVAGRHLHLIENGTGTRVKMWLKIDMAILPFFYTNNSTPIKCRYLPAAVIFKNQRSKY